LRKLFVNVYGGLHKNYYVLNVSWIFWVIIPFSASPVFSVLLLWRR